MCFLLGRQIKKHPGIKGPNFSFSCISIFHVWLLCFNMTWKCNYKLPCKREEERFIHHHHNYQSTQPTWTIRSLRMVLDLLVYISDFEPRGWLLIHLALKWTCYMIENLTYIGTLANNICCILTCKFLWATSRPLPLRTFICSLPKGNFQPIIPTQWQRTRNSQLVKVVIFQPMEEA